MAAPIFQRTVVDTQGNVVEGAVVEVRNEATDELAPIFVDRELTDVKANPFTTDSTGFIRFFAAAGDYRIKATFGAEEIIFRFVQLIDTDELIDFDSAQTLTNKTLTSPALTNPSYTGTLTGGTGVVNLGSGQLFKDSDGNVRINTTGSSAARLYVRGAGTTSATASFEASNSAGATRMFVQDDGTTQFFGSAGSETARITSAGTLAINNPPFPIGAISANGLVSLQDDKNQFLSLGMSSNNAQLRADFFSGAGGATPNITFLTTSAERMRITSAGNVGIGTSSPATSLHVLGSAVVSDRLFLQRASASLNLSIASYWNGSGSPLNGTRGDIVAIGNTGSDGLVFVNGDTERMRISGGDLLVGATSSQTSRITAEAIGTTTFGVTTNMTASSGTRFHMVFRENSTERGSVTSNGGGVSYNSASDYRLKENVAPLTGALAKIAQLNPVTYTWKGSGSAGEGFIAHELHEVCPNAVTGAKDAIDKNGKPKYQGIDASILVATLVKAMQEQQAIIESLNARLDAANI